MSFSFLAVSMIVCSRSNLSLRRGGRTIGLMMFIRSCEWYSSLNFFIIFRRCCVFLLLRYSISSFKVLLSFCLICSGLILRLIITLSIGISLLGMNLSAAIIMA